MGCLEKTYNCAREAGAVVGLFGRQGGAAYRIRPAGRHCILKPLRFCALDAEVLAPRLLMAFRLPLQLFTVACPANARDNGLIRFVAINRYLNITEIRIDRQGVILRNSEILTEVKMKKPRSRSNEANKANI